MRSRTEHVWPEHLKEPRAENAEYKKFKQLTGELIDITHIPGINSGDLANIP